jgi:RNA polymerase sigma-70 factor (ECF subfamily)
MKVINFQENGLIQLAVENNQQAQQQVFTKMLSVCRQYIKDIHQAEYHDYCCFYESVPI